MKGDRTDSGMILVIVMFVLVTMTLLGVWSLSTTSGGILRSGNYKSKISNQNEAEEGINQALLRIQQMANVPPGPDGYNTSAPKDRRFLTNNTTGGPCLPGVTLGCAPLTGADPACADKFKPSVSQDVVEIDPSSGLPSNVICNFGGRNLPSTQVILVRKEDQGSVAAGNQVAVYLVNAIATDTLGRRRISQAVVIVPYNNDIPYFAATAKLVE